MTCRHKSGDMNCSSRYRSPVEVPGPRVEVKVPTPTPMVDAANFVIEDLVRVGAYMVLKVRYPSCKKCEYEGLKVMVLPGVTEIQILKWKKIDPHFRYPEDQLTTEAPSPIARFPGSVEGWTAAVEYAQWKSRGGDPK